MKNRWTRALLALMMLCTTFFGGCADVIQGTDDVPVTAVYTDDEDVSDGETLDADGYYTTPEDVALYIHLYGELPGNFITKREAQELGWDSKEGNLWEVADGMSIGGDRFGNREGLLPEDEEYTECDVNYNGGFRGSERLVFSGDGDIYYTADHYETFEQLY